MVISLPRRFFGLCLMIGILSGLAGVASAQPALAYPNDQAPASILFFNKYTSNLSTPHLQDTQISVTNTNQNTPIDIHMFLVDGSTCSVADSFISLTPNQTISFFMSDYDPGIQGYIVMVAAAGGTPTQFNYLIGSEFIRESDGHLANLAAVGIQKISPGDVVPNGDGTASLIFNNVEYQRLPSILAVSSFNSQVTHNTNLALYSPSNNLLIGNPQSTTIFALVFDESENPYSTTIRIGCFNPGCHYEPAAGEWTSQPDCPGRTYG